MKTNTHITSSSKSSEVSCTYRNDLLQHKPMSPWEIVTDFWSIDTLEGNRSRWWAITGDLTSVLLWDQCAGSPSINISFEDGTGEEPFVRVPGWINLGLNASLVTSSLSCLVYRWEESSKLPSHVCLELPRSPPCMVICGECRLTVLFTLVSEEANLLLPAVRKQSGFKWTAEVFRVPACPPRNQSSAVSYGEKASDPSADMGGAVHNHTTVQRVPWEAGAVNTWIIVLVSRLVVCCAWDDWCVFLG